MNNRGQIGGAGLLITLAITLIVGAIFLQASAQNVGSATDLGAITNLSIGTQTNGTAYYFTDYKELSDVEIYGNATSSGANVTKLTSTNYTITNNVIYNGALAVKLEPNSALYTATSWNISATTTPLTYISDSGGRSTATLIIILSALALLAVAVGYGIRRDWL